MKPKSEPLTLVEAEHEFQKVARTFDGYVEKTKHLGLNIPLVANIGEDMYARSQDPDVPWVPFLYAAANLMNRDDCSPEEIKDTFERFIKDVVLAQAAGHVPPSPAHPFELMRAVMVATIDELMPALRPMHEFDAIVARAGGEDALKMRLVHGFYTTLQRVLNDTLDVCPGCHQSPCIGTGCSLGAA
jgi:hypothetical protein